MSARITEIEALAYKFQNIMAGRGTEGYAYSYSDGSIGTSSHFRGMTASHWRCLPAASSTEESSHG